MKAICKLKTVITGNQVTITGELVDVTAPLIIGQRSTIMHPVQGNQSNPRHMQVNSHGFVFKRNGSDGVLFPKDEMASVALEIDNKLTDAPVFLAHPTVENLMSAKAISEIDMTGETHESADGGKTWNKIPDPDAGFKGTPGNQYRFAAKNNNGISYSEAVEIPKLKS